MPAVKVWGKHGTARRYRQGGCDDLRGGEPGTGNRCAACVSAMQEARQRQKAGQMPSNVRAINDLRKERGTSSRTAKTGYKPTPKLTREGANNGTNPPPPPNNSQSKAIGINELAVIEQTSEFKDDQPAHVQMAINCARILDNEERVALWPTTTRQLFTILEKLGAGQKKKSRGRLQAVQAKGNVRRAN